MHVKSLYTDKVDKQTSYIAVKPELIAILAACSTESEMRVYFL